MRMNATRAMVPFAAVLAAVFMMGAGCGKQSATTQTPAKAATNAVGSVENPASPAGQAEGSASGSGGTNAPATGDASVGTTVTAPQPSLPAGQGPGTAAPAPTTSVHEITMTAKKWEFSPARVTVKQGEKVRLLITSTDVNHGFFAPALNLSGVLEPGKTSTIEFTADKKGTFDFRCSVFCGSGHAGMAGVIVVE